MSSEMATRDNMAGKIEQALIGGNLAQLTPEERVVYYDQVCDSLGMNKFTRPFDYITLNGKLTLYASKNCAEQLRNIHGVNITGLAREVVEGVYVVTAQAKDKHGRTDESIGAVPIDNLKGEARANAMMKAETKAKRRVTLSICGLGMLDETEVETIPGATVHHTEPAKQLPAREVEPEPEQDLEEMTEEVAQLIQRLAESKGVTWTDAYWKMLNSMKLGEFPSLDDIPPIQLTALRDRLRGWAKWYELETQKNGTPETAVA